MSIVKAQWPNMAPSRHLIPWNKGMFLRFLGVLIQMCLTPVPNSELHWRRPQGWEEDLGWEGTKIKTIIREIIFRKYW